MEKIKSVIMAGGIGARFWPLSRKSQPKQFLKIFGDKTLLESTFERVRLISDPEDIFIVSNAEYREQLIRLLPEVPQQNLLLEPMPRNTAPCIGFAAAVIERKAPGSVMAVFPADHFVGGPDRFAGLIRAGAALAADEETLITIGIEPTHPETGYGYIQVDEPWNDLALNVKTFAEKPNLATARRFLASGDFLWNSGMFIWRSDVILAEMRQHLDGVWQLAQRVMDAYGTDRYEEQVELAFAQAPAISIDYGILEHSDRVLVLRSDFSWSDVGSWDEVWRMNSEGDRDNVVYGDPIVIDSNGSYIHSASRLAAVIGVRDLIIVDTDDALLVVNRKDSQKVKYVIDELKVRREQSLL